MEIEDIGQFIADAIPIDVVVVRRALYAAGVCPRCGGRGNLTQRKRSKKCSTCGISWVMPKVDSLVDVADSI